MRIAHLDDIWELSHDDYYRFVGSAAHIERDPEVAEQLVRALEPDEHKHLARLLTRLSAKAPDLTVRQAASEQLAIHLPTRQLLGFLWRLPVDVIFGGRRGPFEAGPVQHAPLRDAQRARLVAIGDFGTPAWGADDLQNKVGSAIATAHRAEPFDFGITLGDNFYPWGFESQSARNSPRWTNDWDVPYAGVNIPFFPALGNHDWYGGWRGVSNQVVTRPGDPMAKSPAWTMPGPFYEIDAGPLRLLAIDTHRFMRSRSGGQRDWLRERLSEKTERWTVVYGHHPMHSGGSGHGTRSFLGDRELKKLRNELATMLQGRAHIFVAGHEHDMQVFERDSVLQVIAGTSGKTGSKPGPIQGSRFCGTDPGYLVVDATMGTLTLALRTLDGNGKLAAAPAAACTLRRGADGRVETDCGPVNCRDFSRTGGH